MAQEKRKTARTPANYEVFVSIGRGTSVGQSSDISLYGVGLRSEKPIPIGTPIEMSLVVKDQSYNFNVKGVVRHCTDLADGAHIVGVEFTEGHEKGLPFVETNEKAGEYGVRQTVTVDVDVATCYRLLTPERFPEWTPEIKSATVVTRYPDGRPKQVEFMHDFVLLKIRYTDEYTYDDEKPALSWHTVGGDKMLINNVGGYTLLPLRDNQTSLTFSADIIISIIPSRRLINYFSTIGVRKALKGFKAWAEKQAAKK